MPLITDWLMVGITLVYVIATIVICSANITSAKGAKDQLDESRRQYEEGKRLENMPFLHFEICQFEKAKIFGDMMDFMLGLKIMEMNKDDEVQTIEKRIIIKNVGKGTAKDIYYVWNNMTASYKRDDLRFRVLQPGENKKGMIVLYYHSNMENFPEVSVDMRYKDLLNNCYEQRMTFVFQNIVDGIDLKSITVDAPVLKCKEKSNA